MQIAFLIIITFLGSAYSLVTKQSKTALGLFVVLLALVLQIPDLVTGFWVNLLLALSLMIFTVGIGIIVWKKKVVVSTDINDKVEKEQTEPKDDTVK